MAKKRYRNLSQLVVAGAEPGKEFEFDYDRPGYDAKSLIDTGIIRPVESKPKPKAKE